MAAALIESLLMNHPFVGRNKRVAFFAADVFLRLNGFRLEADAGETYDWLTELFRSGNCDLEHLSAWIRRSVTR